MFVWECKDHSRSSILRDQHRCGISTQIPVINAHMWTFIIVPRMLLMSTFHDPASHTMSAPVRERHVGHNVALPLGFRGCARPRQQPDTFSVLSSTTLAPSLLTDLIVCPSVTQTPGLRPAGENPASRWLRFFLTQRSMTTILGSLLLRCTRFPAATILATDMRGLFTYRCGFALRQLHETHCLLQTSEVR